MISNYEILLSSNNDHSQIYLPQLPEKFEVSQSTNNTSVDVIGLGEIVVINDRPAITISFESVFPIENSNPQSYVDKIQEWIKEKKPIHLIISGTEINMFCAIENFNYNEIGGDVGSIYYSLSFKEYREPTIYDVQIRRNVAVIESSGKRIDNREQAKTYTAQSNDCLYNIAKSQLGDESKWIEIAKLNQIKSPYYIYPNQILKLPR